MATVAINFESPANVGGTSVFNAYPRKSESVTSSGTSQQTTITALANEAATITSTGGNVWVKAGQSPTAAAGDNTLVLDGETKTIGPMRAGDEIAIIDA